MNRITLLFFVLFLCGFNAKAQKKDPTAIGEIKGVVRDSLHNFSLASATVAVYSKADSTLIGYQLANRLGEFSSKTIPIGKSLYADFTYLGYKAVRRYFTISTETKLFDFKNVNLSNGDITLNEVQVKPSPVRMNKDTLEFFADAYTLEKSASVEDLVRKLDGLTVWGDGSITFKGEPIRNLTVNGKPFFGGDVRVATQNLPKNIVEKIQVFNTASRENPLDSIINMNIKLKKGMNKGLFGKIGGGYGTKERYGVDASLKVFNDRMQVALLAASNNTNKTAGSVSALQQYSSFGGEGTSTDYTSNFRRAGLNKQYAGGVQFQYDFLKLKKNIQEQKLLTGDYFLNKNFNDTKRTSVTDRALPQATTTRKSDSSSNANVGVSQDLNLKYAIVNSKNNLTLASAVRRSEANNQSSSNGRIVLQSGAEQSNNVSQNSLQSNYNAYEVNGAYSLFNTGASNFHRIMPTFDLSFVLSTNEDKSNEIRKTQFTSMVDPSQNKDYNRKYATNSKNNHQMLQLKSMPLQYLIFGKSNARKLPSIQLVNTLNLNQSDKDAFVSDLNPAQNSFIDNSYLTNNSNYKLSNDVLGLSLRKYYDVGSLEGRYSKNLNLTVDLQNQFLNQQNNSDKIFQNIKRNYNTFLPVASIIYSNYQDGSHSNTLSFNYKTSIDIPEIYQLAPLVDSIDVYNFYQGNNNLKESYKHQLSVSFSHSPTGIKKAFNYNWNFDYNAINDYITENISYDAQGRRTIFYQNANGYRSFNLSSYATKTFKLTNHQFQFRGSLSYSFIKRPAFVNGINNLAKTNTIYGDLNIGYSFKDKVFLDVTQSINSSASSNGSGLNLAKYSNFFSSTSSSLSVIFFKGLTAKTNVNFQSNNPSTGPAINYTIWNASLVQRFTEEKNFELRLDALDLLRQNKSISIFNDGTTLTNSQTNTLTQYFMVSISYFPRKFGSMKKK